MNRINQLHSLGQSIWYDNIQRSLLENGELARLIQNGDIRGITSNPTIFNHAIAKSDDYNDTLVPMAWAGLSAEEIFYGLAVEDIQAAADLFAPLYRETKGMDGFVSLEVNPNFAHGTEETVREAKRLWEMVNRPNLMVKIPATKEGIPAIRKAVAAGLNINITLIFSRARYAEVIDAYLDGLEDRVKRGESIDRISSVASFFVSRVDTKVDATLQSLSTQKGADVKAIRGLMGKAAIDNAKLAYAQFIIAFGGDRFSRLKAKGARVQRPLWASTSTKNPSYRDVLYIEELIGADTVNTVPPQTLEAFRDHGVARKTLADGLDEAKANLDALAALGVSLDQVTAELEAEGVKAFADSFTALLNTIEERRKAAVGSLGALRKAIPGAVKKLADESASKKLYSIDPTLWTKDPSGQAEIRKRLGWLTSPEKSLKLVEDISSLLADCKRDEITHALLLGMGGSSLAPEVFSLTFTAEEGVDAGLKLRILDSTDPGQVASAARWSPVKKTLYIVSSKSGSTSEINAFMEFFWARANKQLGKKASRHFIAITDPGTSLEKLARERRFRKVFLADPDVGGRYSVLTAFGMVPAGLLGLDLPRLLSSAGVMASRCNERVPVEHNPGLALGAVIGQAALEGRDKLTILTDPGLESFGNWLEQLVAESSGKEGRGIVPVVGEPVQPVNKYGKDRIFAYLRTSGKYDQLTAGLTAANIPVTKFNLRSRYDMGAEFYRWEAAVAIACAVLRVNAFDQPDVQDSKTRTAQKISQYNQSGKMPEGEPVWKSPRASIYSSSAVKIQKAGSLSNAVKAFLADVKPGDYVAINAYIPRNPRNQAALRRLRRQVQEMTGAATTLGFGPRFLHSTGQLHKGGAENGVFLQITVEPEKDLEIPGLGISFGILEKAQALGDLEALQARNRRVIRIHLKDHKLDGILD